MYKREIHITEEKYEEYRDLIVKKWEKEGKHYKINEQRISLYEL